MRKTKMLVPSETPDIDSNAGTEGAAALLQDDSFSLRLEKAELDDAHMRFVIDDVRVRHKALIDLINYTSDQALKFLSLYTTLELAAASGIVAGISNFGSITAPVTVSLAAGLVSFAIGSFYCFRAMKTASVGLPGRDPAFWVWASEHKVSRAKMFGDYLENVQRQMAENRALNEETAAAGAKAKAWGIWAPILAMLAGGAAVLAGRITLF